MAEDRITVEDIKALAVHEDSWCLSLYMPSHRETTYAEEDRLRFKNLLKKAETQLEEIFKGNRKPSMGPAEEVQADRKFWQNQSDGLALFLAPDFFHSYRLPFSVPEVVMVSRRFHIKPLLPLVSADGRFSVLAISQNQVSLLDCTKFECAEVDLPGVPRSLAEALKYDDPERQLQFHTGTPSRVTGKRAAVFHGQGVGTDDSEDRLLRFCRMVNKSLQPVIPNRDAPMVLAAVDKVAAEFRRVNTVFTITDGEIRGNPDETPPQNLHDKAREIVEPLFREEQEQHRRRHDDLLGTGLSSSNVEEVVRGSHRGRVDVLFVAVGTQVWGRYDAEADALEYSESPQGDMYDLLDFAAAHTLIHGGVVHATDPSQVPGDGPIAAIFRY
ncbi:MAG: hypothetical protein RDU20_11260 [Desulfomonilaceae bacterium]|nr:hypothetical protein [Desulfomonilaceae bacterium]